MRRYHHLALAGALCASAACAPSHEHDPSLEVVVPTEAATLDPRFTTRSLDIKVTRLVHAGLIGLHPDTLAPVPLVAESWSYRDERTLAVVLRPGVRFHSGHPLEPEDVCATIAALNDPALASPHRAVVKAIGGCNAGGPRTVVIELAEPRATLLTDLELPVLRAEEARSAPRPDGDLDGLGPYRLAKVRRGELSLQPASTGVLPEPERAVVVRTVRDENARALRLLAGRADVAPSSISATLLPALEKHDALDVSSRSGANVTYLLMHNERAPFDREPVRRATARAIDRARIVDTLLAGRGRVASQIFPEGHWAHAPGLEPVPFEPERARPVLAGLPEVTLLTSTDRARRTIARATAQMLGDAGLSVRVVPLDLGVMLERLDAGDYELAILQMPELTEPNILKWFFHPSGVPGEGGVGKNRARYRTELAGRLLDTASETRDRRVRARTYRQLAELMARELPVVPLWHEDQVAVTSKRARGFQLSAEGRWSALARLR